ncbi:MAG: HAMP domain-containing sensor histidine kinase [Campylobacterota bacterium]|nr:HAMP domain-containing sensor histidine kinase [Campylobacterota bacterium]
MKEKTDKTIDYIESFLDNDYVTLQENLKILLKDYKRKSSRLDKIIKQSDKQQLVMMKLNEELDEYKNHLEKKVEEEIASRKEKEKMLFQQSRLASMGEMMDAVAHQWKQPINIINMQVDMMGYDFEDELIDEQYVEGFQKKVSNQVKHMTSTLEEFRNFFRPSKDATDFDVAEMVGKVLLLVKDEFIKFNIEVVVKDEQKFSLHGVENEFKHLVLNIINNSKDAFNENKTEDRKIVIELIDNSTCSAIEIADNAGGIPLHVIDDIFKANITTKEEGKGTGIGLYMSSQIAQKHNGELSVENVDGGAKFRYEQLKF